MTKKKHLQTEVVDLSDIVKILLKNKISIIIVSLIFSFIGGYYAAKPNSEFKAEILINEPPIGIFINYSYAATKGFEHSNPTDLSTEILHQNFLNNFNKNINSLDKLESFYNQNNNIDSFKNFLEKQNISVKNYFRYRFYRQTIGDNKSSIDKYSLFYDSSLDGAKFLNNYIRYIYKDTVMNFKGTLKNSILNTLKLYKLNYEIASKLNLEDPVKDGINQKAFNTGLYSHGTKVLSLRINFFEKMINELENDNFNYNPILDKALTSVDSSKNIIKYSIYGLIGGGMISFLFVLIRTFSK